MVKSFSYIQYSRLLLFCLLDNLPLVKLKIGASGVKANILVGAKHSGSKSLVITNKLSAGMLRPSKIEMHQTYKASLTMREC